MVEIKEYQSASDYLVATEQFLEFRELENNLLLGQSRKFVQNFSNNLNDCFLNILLHGEIKSSMIKSNEKAYIGSISEDEKFIRSICAYFLQKKIEIKGVIGAEKQANIFAENYQRKIAVEKPLVLCHLNNIAAMPKPEGHFELATIEDLPTIALWESLFREEANLAPIGSDDLFLASNLKRIKNNEVYKWIIRDEMVSMVSKIRDTRNIAFIGNVYTPKKHRGYGYASSCVHQLSELMLKSGYKSCGLYADKNNVSLSRVCKRLGYVAGPEFLDILFN
jgi:predicted GNAT family acetyltransferase